MKWCLGLAVFVSSLAAGCEAKRPNELPVYQVKGRVTYKGEPVSGAVVVFTQVQDQSSWALRPRDYADMDGVYQLSTYEHHDGAPAGEYIVTVWWPEVPFGPDTLENGNEPDRLKLAYKDPAKSKIRVTVKPEPNTIDINLP